MELNKYAQLLLEEAKETGCLPVLDRFHCAETDQYAQISFPLNDALSAVSVTEMNLSKPLCEALTKAGIHTYEQVLSVLLHRGQRKKQLFSPAMLDDMTAAVIDFSYLGIAFDEPHRLERLQSNQISLMEKYHVTEQDARRMVEKAGLLSPIYRFTNRGGCWFCPNASLKELRHLYFTHPDLWNCLMELQDVPNKTSEYFSWTKTVRDLDRRFRMEGLQLSFYDEER